MRYVIEVGTVIPAQPPTNEDNMSAIKYSVIGSEIGAHLGGKLVALRFSGVWCPSFESRAAGQVGVCPLILGAIRSDFSRLPGRRS